VIRALALACAAVLGAPAGAVAQSAPPAAYQDARAHWAVQRADAETQRLIDRGVLMLYAFDVGEARVAFGEAIKRNPDAALAYWGEAEADTIDINLPQSDAGDRRGAAAVDLGRRHLAHASETERMLVDAIAKRYGPGTKRERFTRYADALSAWTKTHRDDPNVLAVAAYAIWNAEDNVLSGEQPTAKAREMLGDLDDALKLEPANLGAHHLRIHLLEEMHRSQEAVPDAEALRSYAYPPGTSHLPHMSGHIWARLGDYAKLIDDNERAVKNDEEWFAQGDGPGQQYMHNYHDHDVDFVLYGLTTVGRDDEARAFAKHEDTTMQLKTAVRLHDDARVEELAKTPGASSYAALAAYVAAARRGDEAAAEAARAKLSADKARLRSPMADAAAALLAHDKAAYVAAYARAYDAAKNGDPGDPKNSWQMPPGEGYGAALLGANRAADAEKVFTAELKRYPNDPHLEWGLAEALKAEGKDDSAARAAYRSQWKGTRDLTLADLG
jgi:predicted negative regulator of RcsB-dependent stress response